MARKKEPSGGLPDGLIVGFIAFLLGVTLLFWTATGIAGVLAHGGWPGDAHFTKTPQAMRHLVSEPHDIPAAWPGAPVGELPGSGLFWGIFISQFMVLFVLTVFVLNAVARTRARLRSPRQAPPAAPVEPAPVPAPRRRRGTAVTPSGTGAPGAKSVSDDGLDAWFRSVPGAPGAAQDAPTTQLPPLDAERRPAATLAAGAPGVPGAAGAASLDGSASRTDPLVAALPGGEVTRTYALFAGPRGDKAKRIVQPAVLAAAGPVVVTTADPETYQQTVGNRAKLGPVHVYDPAHLLDVPGRLRWAPHGGCEQPATAGIQAAALLAPLRPSRADEAIVHDTAVTLLRCWLHAAAVDGLPFRQVHRWAAGGAAAGEAVRILRTDTGAASGWSGELESVLHAHPERRDAAQALIRKTLEPLNSVHIRDACNPTRIGGLDMESFVAERGTLYVVGERIEDPRTHLGAMPLLTALVSSVVEHGRRMAAMSSAGRLDPPLTFVLDDVAALAPLPALPELLATGESDGLPTLAVLRSPEQALARWQSPLWQQATLRLALGENTAASLPPAVPDAIRLD
ncbi:type VI secretion protein [Streptomyces sp. NPDC051976]|uniref:type VI secretion protein n=1 Tax=Streptomyces sp. NPDC051976 TaxID=3154947 RepID=UPI003437771C